MTHVDMGVKQTAAEFLFVLCKESGEQDGGGTVKIQERVSNCNYSKTYCYILCLWRCLVVDNLLKYTGYGNAAGLLVARGLLAGGRGETQYSEDEDSDTEEYKSAKPL